MFKDIFSGEKIRILVAFYKLIRKYLVNFRNNDFNFKKMLIKFFKSK